MRAGQYFFAPPGGLDPPTSLVACRSFLATRSSVQPAAPPFGAGTTGAGLRAGVPAVTVPMTGDQPFCAARIAALGAGPPPIRYRRLSVPVLTAAIQDAGTRPPYRARARTLAARLAREDAAAPVLAALAGCNPSAR